MGHVAVQTVRADLAKEVLLGVALALGILGGTHRKVEARFHWGQKCVDQGVKVGRDLSGEVLDSRGVGVPSVREGAASCDPVEGVRQGRREVGEQHQGEDSSCSEAEGGSSYYVVEGAQSVQVEGSSCSEVRTGHRAQAGD